MAFRMKLDTPDGGVAEYHKVGVVSLDTTDGRLAIEVRSYRDSTARYDGLKPVSLPEGPPWEENYSPKMTLTAEQYASLKPQIDALLAGLYHILAEAPQYEGAKKA